MDLITEFYQSVREHGIYILDVLLAFVGYFLAKWSKFPMIVLNRLTQFLVTVIYPCLIFSTLTSYFRIELLLASWDMPVFLVAIMATGFGVGLVANRFSPVKNWPKDIRNSFIFMAAMPNYVFIPLVITQGFWGVEATALLILASFGGDLFLWLVAIPALGVKGQWLKLFAKPPVLALLAAIGIILWDQDWMFAKLDIVYPLLASLGSLTVPSSMLILGAYLGNQPFHLEGLRSQLVLSAIRLLVTPFLCGLVLIVTALDVEKSRVLFLIATMPTAIASAILARLFGGNPAYCAQQILVSHVLALISVPLWLYWARYFF